MSDVIKTYQLSPSLANEAAFVQLVARHGNAKRLHRVQVLLWNGSDEVLNPTAIRESIQVYLAQKSIHSAVSVRMQNPAAPIAPGVHELKLFEHPSFWTVWLNKLGLGRRSHGSSAKPSATPVQPATVTGPPNFNRKLHEAFRLAVRQYNVNSIGDWTVSSLVFNYGDQQAYDTLAPLISAMPAEELLNYLSTAIDRSNLVPADMLTVAQHLKIPTVSNSTTFVSQGDLWVDVIAHPPSLGSATPTEGTAMPGVTAKTQAKPRPSFRCTLDPQTNVDQLVRKINQHVKTNTTLTRLELRLSHWGQPPLTEAMAKAAVVKLLQDRGLVGVQVSIKPYPYELQHADTHHTLSLFEATPASSWWQRANTTHREPVRQEPSLRSKDH